MYKKILIVVDGEPKSRAAIKEGIALARIHGAEAVFFSVLPRYVPPMSDMPMLGTLSPEEFERSARNDAERLLAAATALADRAGVRSTSALGKGGDDAECIAEAARKRRCSLIVAATAGRNAVLRLLAGSVIPGLITHAHVPVLVCRAPARAPKSASATP